MTTSSKLSTPSGPSGPTPIPAPAPPETRRARQRRELTGEIVGEALRQLEEGGPGAVTWRAIARTVGMGPASLYTYFASLDDLFTELLVQSYKRLSDAIGSVVASFDGSPVGDRLLVGPLAYRRWALDNPAQFNLIFTDQIPGYEAPVDGPTVDAQVAVFLPMVEVYAEALGVPFEPDLVVDPGSYRNQFLGLWGTFHGLTMLEVNHHLGWVEASTLFEERLRWEFAQAGLPAADPKIVESFEQRWVDEIAS